MIECLVTRRQFSLAMMGGAVSLMSSTGHGEEHSAAAPRNSRDLAALTLAEASWLLHAGRVTSAALVQACLHKIADVGVKTNAFITVTREQALAQARALDAEAARHQFRSALHGIPIALKDNIDTAGVRTTMASAVFADRVPNEDAEVVRRLQAAGAIVIGKTNLGELCMSATAAISHFGPVRNPHALDLVSGGSSGGSGAAVAANCCYGALGADSGGSVRIPAAYCGIVALKPTCGLVPMRGILSGYRSFDTCGPMARSVEDVALLLDAITGFDALDMTSIDHPRENYRTAMGRPVSELRIGVPRKPYFDDLDPEVEKSVETALKILGTLTHSIKDAVLPPMLDFSALENADTEIFAHNHHLRPQDFARLDRKLAPDSVTESPARPQKCVETMDTYVQKRWQFERVRSTADQAFSAFDVVALPTMKRMPRRIEDVLEHGDDAATLIQNTKIFNIYGWPAISLPCGFSSVGVPIGLMIGGPKFSEGKLLALAHAYEQTT
jgi:aspartyl-tRNA(Asn)/glutamyl-tRNA(Gln) amidotransferase subunit A